MWWNYSLNATGCACSRGATSNLPLIAADLGEAVTSLDVLRNGPADRTSKRARVRTIPPVLNEHMPNAGLSGERLCSLTRARFGVGFDAPRYPHPMSLTSLACLPRGKSPARIHPFVHHRARVQRTLVKPLGAVLLFCAAAIVGGPQGYAQGCVAIKEAGEFDLCSLAGDETPEAMRWSMAVNYEHFRSHRHFVGTEQQFHRDAAGTEVINVVEQINVALRYELNPKMAVTFTVPYFYASRSSLYEHDRINRYKTHGKGIGDVRLSVSRWLRDPRSGARNNLAFGVGLKAPTGDSNYKDDFHTAAGIQRRNVDQSIQPGDGAWGFVFTAQAYQRIGDATALYANGSYLVNPKETNGTRSNAQINSPTAYFSVADQYQGRLGITHRFTRKHAFSGSLGLLAEGIPASDLIGGDKGFRRPGYVVSVEPGLSFALSPRDAFTFSVPYAIRRDRVRSYADKINERHGDAAFADFTINFGYVRKW